jgi:hypothetical protein
MDVNTIKKAFILNKASHLNVSLLKKLKYNKLV